MKHEPTTQELAAMLGVTKNALKNYPQKWPAKFIRDIHWAYSQRGSLSGKQYQTIWKPEGILKALFFLKHTPEIEILIEWLVELGTRELEKSGLPLKQVMDQQKSKLVKGKEEKEKAIQAQHDAKCRHQPCGRILSDKISVEAKAGHLCRTGKCKCFMS